VILTCWKEQKEGQIRSVRESKQVRITYRLKKTEEGVSQNAKESEQATGTHSLQIAKVKPVKGRR
jgi:hypothetical protein